MNGLLRRAAVSVAALLLSISGVARAQFTAYGITTTAQGVQQLVRFNTASPSSVTTVGVTGANLTGIDFRPATGELYGYDGNLLYTLNLSTGAATVAFDVGNTSGNAGFDFNPTVDRVRVVDASGTNLRLNPLNGATTVDAPYVFAPGDVNFGATPSFTAVAYTNSVAGASTTTLYGIDAALRQLVQITNPNGGAINTIGSLGIGPISAILGFDIVTVGAINSGFFTATAVGASSSQLYSVNLSTGAASLVGALGPSTSVAGLALTTVPEPGTWALLAAGLAGIGVIVGRRRAQFSR